MDCRICGNTEGNRLIQVREMMVGLRELFDYLECAACGTLQIAQVPADLGRYYGSGYYSYAAPKLRQNVLHSFLRQHRARHYLGQPDLLGRLLARKQRRSFFDYMRRAGAGLDTPVLDVGTGNGALLGEMFKHGFRNLTGVDPFIAGDIIYNPWFRVYKRDILAESGQYGVVMMNHSFEHMDRPQEILAKARTLLRPGGTLLVRVPLAGGYSYRKYGKDWVGIDAPRHLYLYTQGSFTALAARAGLRVREVVYDGDSSEFWASEQYQRDIPLLDPRSWIIAPEKSIFSRDQVRAWQLESERLNAAGDGAWAGFYLEPEQPS